MSLIRLIRLDEIRLNIMCLISQTIFDSEDYLLSIEDPWTSLSVMYMFTRAANDASLTQKFLTDDKQD